MDNMEFLYQNYCNTTTQFTVDSNENNIYKMYDRDNTKQWETDGYNSTTATTLTWLTTSSFIVSRIMISNHNLKDFTIYHSSVTANTFSLTGYDTTTTQWTGNSETNIYLSVPTTTVTSISILMKGGQTADTEKAIGQLYIGRDYLSFPNNPDYDSYSPRLAEKNVLHKMSDGGVVRYHLKDNFETTIKLNYVSEADRALFKNVYDSFDPFVFIPFPEASTWDGDFYEVNWINGWDSLKLQSNIFSNGYSMNIKLGETPRD